MAVAAPELLALSALFASFFLIMLYYAYGYSIGAVLQAMAAMFRGASVHLWRVGTIGFGFIGDAIDGVDHAVRNALGAGISFTQGGFHYFMHWSAYSVEWIGRAIRELAEETLASLIHLKNVSIPAHVAIVTRPIVRAHDYTADRLRTFDRHAAAILAGTLATLHAAARRAEALSTSVALPRVAGLEREVTALERRIGAAARRLSPSAIVALIGATIFTQLDLGWLRCRGVNRVGRHLCGLSGWLEELFTGAIEALLVVDLCQILTLMAKGAREAEPMFDELVTHTQGLIHCQRSDRAGPLGVQWHEPPPVAGALAL